MSGETLKWYRLASHLHIPVGELKERITSSEFVEWHHYLEQDVNAFHREDYFLAQVAAEIRRTIVRKPQNVKVADLLLKFKDLNRPSVDMPSKMPTMSSKKFWLMSLGIKEEEVC
jgi:hypothetical protein